MPVGHFALVTNYNSDSRFFASPLHRENRAPGPDSEAALKAGNFRESAKSFMKFFDSAAPGRVGKTTFPKTARLGKRLKQKLEASKNDKDKAQNNLRKVSPGPRKNGARQRVGKPIFFWSYLLPGLWRAGKFIKRQNARADPLLCAGLFIFGEKLNFPTKQPKREILGKISKLFNENT